METLIRPAQPYDAIRLAQLFRAAYGKTSHPCQDAANVQAGMESGSERWFVAESAPHLVGCAAAVTHDWNRSFEIGKAVVNPYFRHAGLGQRLWETCTRACINHSSILLYYVARSATIHRVATRAGLAATLAGHDGARHIANGAREYHAYAIARLRARFRHVAPQVGAAAFSPLIWRWVYAPLAMTPLPGAYPPICLAGAGGGADHAADAVELTSERDLTEAELVHCLRRVLSRHTAAHVSAVVLADKVHLIRSLLEMNFSITAYLPAWFAYGDARYDCLMLVCSQFAEMPVINGFHDEFRRLDEAWFALGCAFLKRAVEGAAA